MVHEGRSVFPMQSRYLVPNCAPPSEDQPPSLISIFGCENPLTAKTIACKFNLEKESESKPAPRCHRVTRRAGCKKATTGLSLQNLQSLSHLCYPTDTRQLTSPQGEADGVSDGGMMLQALGGGEFALRLVSHQRVALFYRRTRTHTLYGVSIIFKFSTIDDTTLYVPAQLQKQTTHPRLICRGHYTDRHFYCVFFLNIQG